MLAGKATTDKGFSPPPSHLKVLRRCLTHENAVAVPPPRMRAVILLAGVLLAGASAVNAQSYHGSMRGAVRDPSGNAMPTVNLTLINEETNVARTTVTNESGEYALERIDPGRYRMTAATYGFKKLDRAGVIIETQQQVALDLMLEVGDVAESVTVTDEVSLIETSTPSTGQVLNKQVLDDLPNSGRNPFILSAITPNVIPVGNPTFNRQQDQSGSSAISLAGGPVRGNNYLLDGVPITDLLNRAVIIPSIEAVQEVKIQVNTYDAEAGRTGGGIFNVAGKSGSNQLHGSLFGFKRPSALGANNFFNNKNGIAKPSAGYDLYGGSFGGPVVLPRFGEGSPAFYNGTDRTFFWAAFEGYRQQTFLTETFTVPTARERVGDFSQTRNAGGQVIPVIDPLTGQAFAGNIIPISRQDVVGRNLAQFFPIATGAGAANSGINNYTATSILNDRADQQTIKLDHSVTENYKLSGSYAHYGSREPVADYYQGLVSNPGGSLLFRTVHAVAINNIFTLDPTTVLSARYGYNSFTDSPTTSSAGFLPSSLGFASSFTNDIVFNKFPRINFVGNAYGSATQGALGSSAPSDRRYYSHSFLVGLSKLIDRHSLKFGADYRKLSSDFVNVGQASGDFTFSNAVTGNALANLLLGRVDLTRTNNAQIARDLSTYVDYYAAYVHDDFRLSQKLTLNFGLRYEYETGLQERDNQLTVGFDRDAVSPLQVPGLALRGGLIYAGVDDNPTQQTKSSKTRFAPRAGFAYALNDKTTVRAGYGIFWAPPVFNFTVQGIGALGFSSITTVAGGSTLSNPFPNGLIQPSGSSLGLLTQTGQTVDFVDYERKAAYVQQYSVDLQRELPGGVALTLSYNGSRGIHLQTGGVNDAVININQLTPAQLSLGAQLSQQVANPFFATAGAIGILAGRTVARAQLLRPFPQFGDIYMHGSSGSSSSYNAATVKLQKRFSRGFTFLSSYTFSENLDDITGQTNNYAGGSNVIVNAYDLAAEYGLSTIDTPHRFNVSGSYELPFGNGKMFLSDGFWLNKLVGGWQINAIGMYQSGFPLTFTQSSNNSGSFSAGQRPNLIPGIAVETEGSVSDRVDNYLNPAAFAAAPAFTFGNAGRTINARSPGQNGWDIGLFKDTSLTERFRTQMRLEAINAFNTPVFRAPNTSFGNANFGRVTSQANFARVIQISLRLFW